MAKPDPTLDDRAVQILKQGSRTTPGNTPWVSPLGICNLFVWGDFVGVAEIDVSWDGGDTYVTELASDGNARQLTKPQRLVIEETERGMLYRLRLALTSGTFNYRWSQ